MQFLQNLWKIIKDPWFFIPSIIIILVIMIGSTFSEPVQSNLESSLFKIGELGFSWWSISHVILYAYFGFLFPGYFFEFLFLGIVWEVFETTYCREFVWNVIGCSNSDNWLCNSLNRNRDCRYWYGKIDDIAMNTIGFVIGAIIAKQMGRV